MTPEEGNIQSYRDLKVWQKAMDLIEECYKLTGKLPPSESFGLVSGIRRAATLVASYIADGKGRNNTAEYLQKLSAASGSLKFLETQVLIVDRLKYLPMSEIEPSLGLSDEVGRMLTKLTLSLRGWKG
ncbi:MAG: four helix bundle protein [Blastocatellia bacterium]